MQLEKLIDKIKTFSDQRDWDQFHSVKNLSMALAVESSELMEIYQWITEKDSNDKNNESLKQKAKEEIADVFIYLLRIATKLEINLEEAVLMKMEKNELKYPIEKSKGNSLKYTEFGNE
ncbi:MAG: nucleotide pyrophosphohydrolase [Bacteriovorax sp.]|nr:nucleotide pyrophosphohydrolase [Bacteriovorax sp.]